MKKIIGTLRAVLGGPAVFLFLLSVRIALAGLDKYSELVVADSPEAKRRPEAVRVTYLGVNGYQFEANGRALLVDPYFTRAGLTAVALQQRIEPNEARIAFGLQHIRPSADAVLVTHAHFDHLLDVPEIMRRTNARLVSGATAVNLTMSCGLPRTDCLIVQPGSIRVIAERRLSRERARKRHPIGASANQWPSSSKQMASAFTSILEEHLRSCRRPR